MGTLDAALEAAGPAPAQTQDQGTLSEALKAATSGSTSPVEENIKPVSANYVIPDIVGGAAETVAGGVLGTLGQVGGGLAGIAGAATGSLDRANRWLNWAQKNISTVAGLYGENETETGRGIQRGLSKAFENVSTKPGWFVGDKTLALTKSPLAAATADTATQAAIQTAIAALTGKVAKAYNAPGVSGVAETLPSAMDQGGGIQPGSASSEVVAPTAEKKVLGGGAAVSSSNPYPELTGQKSVRGGGFPQLQASQISGDLPIPEQAVRSRIANEILGDEGGERIRPGVVTGNEDTLRTESALAKASNPTPQGLLLRDKMAEEQRALSSYAEGIVTKTGASQTLLNDAQRGDLLNGTLYGPDSLRSYIDQQKQQIYAEAAQRQGPNPVALPGLEKALTSPQLSSSLKIAGQPNFLPGVSELYGQFKTNGFENPVTGEMIPPNTIAAAQELRKYLNQAWSPDNSMWIGRLKGMIDSDIAQAGGADLYQKANALHSAEQTLYGAPGIKKIFGDTDPTTGIAKGLSSEKILPSINNLPLDQYSHIYNVFDSMANGKIPGAESLTLPPELQMAAKQSKAELAGALVRDVTKAGGDKIGAWNANAANKTMNAYTQKLDLAVPPDVLENLHTLNIGGHIMPNMHSYEGAALQARRLDQAGLLERSLPQIGATIGGVTPIPGGTWAGGKAGEWMQRKAATKRQLLQAQETDAAMEAAAKLGKK